MKNSRVEVEKCRIWGYAPDPDLSTYLHFYTAKRGTITKHAKMKGKTK